MSDPCPHCKAGNPPVPELVADGDLTEVERSAVDLVAGGAESHVEDALHEDREITKADHEAAKTLAFELIEALRSNPRAAIAFARIHGPAAKEAAPWTG